MKRYLFAAVAVTSLMLTSLTAIPSQAGKKPAKGRAAKAVGWLSWRGPLQTGVSLETSLPDKWELGGTNDLWSIPLAGGGTPVIANGRLFALGYRGQGPDLQEILLCAEAETGKVLWERAFSDYLSDITYDRYAIGSPCVDAETGNVYVMTSAGVFSCFTSEGKLLWQHATMEEFGRLTFTNGRTGGPAIDNDLVIVRGITSNWGGEGAAMDRLYAFDKKSGLLVWSAGSGGAPKDNSFARPWFTWHNGKRVLYTGAGDGTIICVNARTGETLWRYPVSAGGMNASVVMYKNFVVAIHADENLDSSNSGRMVAVRVDAQGKPTADSPIPHLDKSAEVWRNDELAVISSSPVLVGNRLYQVDKTGYLNAVDVETGKIVWKHRLGPDQLHASPTYADGKLYVPLQNGNFFIVRPQDNGCEELARVKLEGRCIGAPAIWNGKVYVFSTEKLYCFGRKGKSGRTPSYPEEAWPKPGPTVALQILPAEVRLRPGEKTKFLVRGIDAAGLPTQTFDAKKASWTKYIPPTARVRSEMDGQFINGELVAGSARKPSAGAWQATIGDFKGTFRGRIIPDLPLTENFEEFQLTENAPDGGMFAYPPLPWIGARFKFDVRDLDGNKVFAKTLDNIFFQRAIVFFGHPEAKNYVFEADVRVDGNRRTKSTVGLINQRYFIILNGNAQEIEVNSNQERIKVTKPFAIEPRIWYRMKTQVDIAPDGSGVVRAKAWKKGETEPAGWALEVPHKNAHKNGAPGLFGFSPQSLFKVYIDNILVTPRK
jgi:outer membrane protein assembly factor BamB